MTDFIKGKIKVEVKETDLLEKNSINLCQIVINLWSFPKKQWRYLMQSSTVEVLPCKKNVNVNASLYDIKEYFQRRNDKGRMKAKSRDIKYNELMNHLRDKLKILAQKIEPKVYEYGFLRE